jgi:hypothetical protein
VKYIDPDGEAIVAAIRLRDFEENAAIREIVSNVLEATLGAGAAMGADVALPIVLPASPQESVDNANASMMGLATPISVGSRAAQVGAKLQNIFRDHLTRADAVAAGIEPRGGVVALKSSGKPFEHLREFN